MSLLVVIAGSIFILLGVAHGAFTLRSSPTGGPLAPTDPRVRQAMEISGGLGLAPHVETTLWKAWKGFNLSHSLGAVVGGLVLVVPAAVDFDRALDAPAWVVLALALPPLYFALSIRYWFNKPTIGIGLATGLTTIGVLGGLLG